MAKNGDRGSLLLAVRVRSARFEIAAWVFVALVVGVSLAVSLVQWSRSGQFSAAALGSALSTGGLVTLALHPRIRFCDGGVEIPPTHDQQLHYIKWEQVERHSWNGDTLILTGTNSMLAGGPAQGGSARIPPGHREAIEQIVLNKARKA